MTPEGVREASIISPVISAGLYVGSITLGAGDWEILTAQIYADDYSLVTLYFERSLSIGTIHNYLVTGYTTGKKFPVIMDHSKIVKGPGTLVVIGTTSHELVITYRRIIK